jgi:hypothetical protein
MRWLFSFVLVFRQRRQAREARRTPMPEADIPDFGAGQYVFTAPPEGGPHDPS